MNSFVFQMIVLTASVFLNGLLFAQEATIFRTEFNNPDIEKGWVWMPSPEGKTSYKIEKGRLVLINESGLGQWGKNPAAPKLMRKLGTEDADVTVRMVEYKPVQEWEEAGVILWQDDKNWFKLQIATNGRNVMLNCAGIIDGKVKEFRTQKFSGDSITFRIRKRKGVYIFQYSINGKKYKPLGLHQAGKYTDPMVGVFASRWPNHTKPNIARFDFFEIRKASSVKAIVRKNLVKNGSFETPDPAEKVRPKDWNFEGETAYVDGGHAGKAIMVKSKWSFFGQTIPMTPDTGYKVSCWIKGTVRGDLGQIVFQGAGKTWKDWDLYVKVTDYWRKFEKEIHTPANLPAKIKLMLLSEGCKGEIYFDDIQIVTTSDEPTLLPGQDYIWLEAEEGEANLYPVQAAAASSGKYQHMFGAKSLPPGQDYYYVRMPLKVEKGGAYNIYISASSLSSRWRSVFEVALDGKAIKASPIATQIGGQYLDKIGWADFGRATLQPGDHTLTVRTNQRAVRYDTFCLDVDAAVLVPVSNNWRPDGTSRPVSVPREARGPSPWKPGMPDVEICSDVNEYEVEGAWVTKASGTVSPDNRQPNGKPSLLIKADFRKRAPAVIRVKKTIQVPSPGGRIVLWIDDNTDRPLNYFYGDGYRLAALFTGAHGREIEVPFVKPLFLHDSSGEINPSWVRLEVPICMADNEAEAQYPLQFEELRAYSYFHAGEGKHNEFYLGDLTVEMKGVYFRYFEYDRAEISPDLTSTPLFFGFDCNFGGNTDYPQRVSAVLELPESVKLEKWLALASWTDITDFCSMETGQVTRDGKKLIRYAIDYHVTKNNMYSYSYPGQKRIRYYLSTKLQQGTVDAYYYLRFPEYNYTEPPKKLPLDVVRIKKGIAPKRIMAQMYVEQGWPGMIANVKRLGINRVHIGPAASKEFIEKCEAAGIAIETNIAGGAILENLLSAGAPGAVNMQGEVSKQMPCLSRPQPGLSGVVDQNKYLIDRGFTFFSFDDEHWGGIQCFCETCLSAFEDFRKIHGKNLPNLKPKEFCDAYRKSNKGYLHNLQWWADSRNDDDARKLFRLWQDFHHANYSGAAGLLKKRMQDYAKSKGIKDKIEFYDEWLQSVCSERSARAAAIQGFDYISSNYYGANPKECGDIVQTVGKWVKGSGAKLYWLLGPGLCYWRIQNLKPRKIMKWNVLEAFAAGANGVNMYAYADIDLLDMKYYSDAIWTVMPVEDIMLEGKDGAGYVQITKGQANLRALKKGDEYLILISEYNHSDRRKVQVKLPDAVKGHSVWNLNERKRIGKVSGQNSTFNANLNPEERAVMYYVGSREVSSTR